MLHGIVALLRGVVADVERRAHLKRVERLTDHLLDDIGLRRDQLDSLLLHPDMARDRRAGFGPRRPAMRRSLSGCG